MVSDYTAFHVACNFNLRGAGCVVLVLGGVGGSAVRSEIKVSWMPSLVTSMCSLHDWDCQSACSLRKIVDWLRGNWKALYETICLGNWTQ